MESEKGNQMRTYDVVVIGGGAVGENVADRAVRGGLSAVVIERALVGGECSYWACMPSKALLRPGAALAAARSVPGAGQVPEQIDRAATLDSRTAFTSNWDDASQVEWLENAGIDLIRGEARVTGEREVEVAQSPEQAGLEPEEASLPPGRTGAGVRVRARIGVVLCTGSAPTLPPIPGLQEISPWTSAEATSTDEVPEELVIIGGGVIACEMATAFADLGARVNLIVRGERLLASLDEFVGEAVAESLAAMGVSTRFNTEVARCEQAVITGDGVASQASHRARVLLTDGAELQADRVLVATGRTSRLPQMPGLDPQFDERGQLELDEDLRAKGLDWLYAVGDASGRVHTTHQGKYQARIIGDLLADLAQNRDETRTRRADLRADAAGEPQVVFTRPEVTHVGLTANEARDRGLQTLVFDQDLGAIAGAALHAENYAGQARFVVDSERQVLVGVTMVGPDIAELLHAATIAIIGQVPLERLWHAVPAYPTVSEVWLRFLESAL